MGYTGLEARKKVHCGHNCGGYWYSDGIKAKDGVEVENPLSLSNSKKGRDQDVMSTGVGGKYKG